MQRGLKQRGFKFAAAYVPSHSVSGPELLGPPPGATPGSNIELEMHQYQFTFGYTYKFDETPAPKSPLIHK